jgi:hypothetical protein
MLDEVDDGFDLDQRSSRHVREATEFLRAAPTDALGQVQRDAITGTTPLLRQITLGVRESIDEGARQQRKPSRMLVSLQILEKHAARVISDKNPTSPKDRQQEHFLPTGS